MPLMFKLFFTYQSEVISLIERIQIGEFNIPIEEGQRKELQTIPHSFQLKATTG